MMFIRGCVHILVWFSEAPLSLSLMKSGSWSAGRALDFIRTCLLVVVYLSPLSFFESPSFLMTIKPPNSHPDHP